MLDCLEKNLSECDLDSIYTISSWTKWSFWFIISKMGRFTNPSNCRRYNRYRTYHGNSF